jgi:hypothetical protein
MGCLRQLFAKAVDLATHRALAVEVYGDASGAVLNVQLEDDTVPYFRDYFVTVDFAGWRTVLLQLPATRALFTDADQHFATKLAMRTFTWEHTMAINFFIVTGNSSATLFVGAVEALAEAAATFGAHSNVTVGTSTVLIPDGLRGAPCLSSANVTGCADYVECADVSDAASCRAFDANNNALPLPPGAGFVAVARPVAASVLCGDSADSIAVSFETSATARAEVELIERSTTERLGPFPVTP